MKQRHEIIDEALRIRTEIMQLFADAAYWNGSVREPSVVPINPDPLGEMDNILRGIEKGLQKELLCVHVDGPDELEACVSLEAADKRAAELNAFFGRQPKTDSTPEMRAAVRAWPYSAEAHAEELVKLAESSE